jgi:hypothetical protein
MTYLQDLAIRAMKEMETILERGWRRQIQMDD